MSARIIVNMKISMCNVSNLNQSAPLSAFSCDYIVLFIKAKVDMIDCDELSNMFPDAQSKF